MHIDINTITQVVEIIGVVVSIDGIVKQIALKQGNTKLVSICDLIANDLNEILEVIKLLPSIFAKQPNQPTQQVQPLANQKVD